MGRLLGQIGQRSIRKHVWPHLLRHTSATWWSNRLSHYKLCKRFGWSMTSDMPKRYIDREGIDEMEAISAIRGSPADHGNPGHVLVQPSGNGAGPLPRPAEKSSQPTPDARSEGESPLQILQARLARGEVDLATYRELRTELESGSLAYAR
jgi:hypothetical protein